MPRKKKRKTLPPREVFEIWLDYLTKGGNTALVAQSRGLTLEEVEEAVKEMSGLVFGGDSDDPSRSVQIINQFLIHIEGILSQVLFSEYQRWIRKVREAGDDPEEIPFPSQLVEVSKEVHKLIMNRGQFLLKVWGTKMKEKDEEGEEKEDLSSLLFSESSDLPVDLTDEN